jgi:hypothetical protein
MLLLLLLLQIIAELTPQKCKVCTGGRSLLLLVAFYGTSTTAGPTVATVLIMMLALCIKKANVL